MEDGQQGYAVHPGRTLDPVSYTHLDVYKRQVSDGLHGFASGTLQGSFEGIRNMLTGLSKLNIGGKVGDAISQMSETLSSAGVIGQIISAILSILDLLKDGIGPIISSLIDTIFNAITGILDNIPVSYTHLH